MLKNNVAETDPVNEVSRYTVVHECLDLPDVFTNDLLGVALDVILNVFLKVVLDVCLYAVDRIKI